MSKCKITGKVLVIRLAREETRIVLMNKGSELLHAVVVPTPEGAVEDGMIRNPDAVRKMLAAALQAPEFKRVRQAVFTLCTSQVITETVFTPELPDSKLEKLLQSNVDMYFPVDMRDYQLVWQRVGYKDPNSSMKELAIRLWAVPISMVSRYYAVGNACGLSVAAVDYCGHSIATAVGATFSVPAKAKTKAPREKKKLNLNQEITFGKKKKKEEPALSEGSVATEVRPAVPTDLHLTIEKDLMGMTFVQNGQVVMQRFIQCGDDPSYQFGELAMMVEYFRSMDVGRGSSITGIVSGSMADDSGMMEELSDMLDMPLTALGVPYDCRWMVCVGAAQTNLDFGVPTLNSPGKARRQVQSRLWQYALVLAGGAALISVILTTLSSRLVWDSSVKNLESNVQYLTIQAQTVAGYADNYNKYSSNYNNYSADWDTVFSSLRTYNDNLVLMLEELENTLPENSTVVDLQIAATGMSVQFACENKEEAAYLIMALRDLQYAELLAISNLSGGGSGPATSFGPTEEAPKEGSLDVDSFKDSAIVRLAASGVDRDALIDLATGINPEQLDKLEQAYGKNPVPGFETIDSLKAAYTGKDITQQRADAIKTMLTTNPFAMNGFVDLLEEDWKRGLDAILWWDILDDLVQQGITKPGADQDFEQMVQYMDAMVNILIKDEPTITATENLLATDPIMEQWYIYYLEYELNKPEDGVALRDPLPFLDVEKIVDDLLSNGGFNTGDSDLDEGLKNVISDDVWEIIEAVDTREEIDDLLDKYVQQGTTGLKEIDEIIDDYMENGTTGIPKLDEIIKDSLENSQVDDKIAEMFTKYLTTGSTGVPMVDNMLEKYITTGSTGSEELDSLIGAYIGGGHLDGVLGDLLTKYITEGETGIEILDEIIYKYLTTGSTGNTALDAVLMDYINGGQMDEVMAELINKYLTTGTTGNGNIDGLIYKYLTTGSTGNPALDDLLKAYINGGKFDDVLKELLLKYMTTGSTGNGTLDGLIEKYLRTGSTGNPALDEVIESFMGSGGDGDGDGDGLENMGKDEMLALVLQYLTTGTTGNPFFDSLINQYLETGSTGNPQLDAVIKEYLGDFIKPGEKPENKPGSSGGGYGGGYAADTRIFFAVNLGYSQELINAELARKGLSYGDKIDKVEVTE